MPADRVRFAWAPALFAVLAFAPGACGGSNDKTNDGPRTTGGPSTSAGPGTGGGDQGGGGSGAAGGSGGSGGTCGDGVAQRAEPCDGADLKGKTCASIGFDQGKLSCKPDCTLDTSGCSGVERCQDGKDNDGDGKVDCADPDCKAACANACAAPQVLSDPASGASGDNTGHAALAAPVLCADPMGAPAVAYQITAKVTGFLDAHVTSVGGADFAVAIRSTCASAGAELGCENNLSGPGAEDFVSAPVRQNDTMFVIVSGADAMQSGAFTLDVQSRQTVCGDGIQDPSEACDDGNTTSGDGCSAQCALEATEVEPNNTPATANTYAKPFFAAIGPAGDIDVIRFSIPTGPRSVIAETKEVTAEACTNKLLDSFVELLDSAGTNVLASNDNGGTGFCAKAVAPSLPAGTYYARVKASPAAAILTFPYRLDITLIEDICGDGIVTPGEQCDDGNRIAGDGCSPDCRFELTEAEPNNSSAQANPYRDPFVGSISPAGDVDVVAVSVPGPSSTLTAVTGDNGTGGCMDGTVDTYLEVLAPNGTTVLKADDDSGLGRCSYASVTGLAAGTYYVKVRAAPLVASSTFYYRLNVTVN